MEVQYGPFQTSLGNILCIALFSSLRNNIMSARWVLKVVQVEGMWKSYLWNWDSEWHKLILDIQTIHDKVDSQDENSREH